MKRKIKGGIPTKKTHKKYRYTPYDTSVNYNQQLIINLEKVIEKNCGIKWNKTKNDYEEGIMNKCSENLLSISYQLWNNNNKQFPIQWYSIVLPLKSKGSNYNTTDNYYKLLRSIIFNLKNNVDKYSKEFLEYFFMQLEESAITGIYTVEKNSGFDKYLEKTFPSYSLPDDGRGTNKTVSNSAINQFFLKELKGGSKDFIDNAIKFHEKTIKNLNLELNYTHNIQRQQQIKDVIQQHIIQLNNFKKQLEKRLSGSVGGKRKLTKKNNHTRKYYK